MSVEEGNHTAKAPTVITTLFSNCTSAAGSDSDQENNNRRSRLDYCMPKSSSSSTVQSRNGHEKSKRPKDTSFHQQKMPAVQPIMSPHLVIPTLLVLGIVFVPLGIMQLIVSNKTQEYVFDYTECLAKASDINFSKPPNSESNNSFEWEWKKEPNDTCKIRFKLDKEIPGPVFMYYRLTNFYQNNRLYSRSISYDQLGGKALSYDQLAEECYPLIGPENELDSDGKKIVYYPCGLIANSLFNDTISGLELEDLSVGGTPVFYSFPAKDISWKSDSVFVRQSSYSLDQVRAPPYWENRKGVDKATRKYKNQLPDLGLDERFLNWIRLSALPTFRKFYGKCTASIPPGTYIITIEDNYKVIEKFNGRKALIISESSFLGGKSNFLGIAYLVVGSILLVLGVAFLVKQVVAPRTMGDVRYLPWYQNIS